MGWYGMVLDGTVLDGMVMDGITVEECDSQYPAHGMFHKNL